jgi:hypothetical protein
MGQWCTLQTVIIWATCSQSPYNYRNQWLPKGLNGPPIDALPHVSGEVSPTFRTIGHVKNNFITPFDNLAWQQAQPHVLDLSEQVMSKRQLGALENVIHLLVLYVLRQQAQPHALDLKQASHEQTTIGCLRKCYPSACIICFEVMFKSFIKSFIDVLCTD